MSGPTSVVGNATSFSHNETRAFLPGVQGGSTGHTMALPGGIGEGGISFNSHYVRGKSHSDFYDQGVQNTNGRSVYHMAQDVSSWKKVRNKGASMRLKMGIERSRTFEHAGRPLEFRMSRAVQRKSNVRERLSTRVRH
jgi:hypothetical protein